MKHWKAILALALVLALGTGALVLRRRHAAARSTPGTYLIGMSQANLIEPSRVTMNLEFQEAARQYDNLRVIYTDAAQDSQRQIEDIRRLMGFGIDLLVVSPDDTETLRPILSEVYQKIPVIVLDRAVSGGDYTLFIGPDNDQIGYLAGQRVLELLGERGGTVVEILGMRDTSPVTERQEGFLRALKAHPEITIEGALYANWMQDQAQDRFKEYLVVYGKSADVVFAQNDAMAYGAWLAARDLRVEGISFIGADGLDVEGGGVDLVNRGILDSTIYYPTGARQAVEYSMRILSGEKLEEKQIILTPERIP